MSVHPKMPDELVCICKRWSQILAKLKEQKERIEYIQNELPALLHNSGVFVELLSNIVKGGRYPDIRQPQMFDDEILLYLNTQPIFSIRMFIYEPLAYTPIHDHNSWGVIGSALGKIGVVKYVRVDDGSVEDYARLHQAERVTLALGETDVALPLDQGIHQTGNADGHAGIMVSVYGRLIRRVYIQQFDMENNKVYRRYSPRVKKKLLAAEALSVFKE
ncbi:MAG: hypothetical protein JSV83_04335 [Desulfobacterales bacterium]|nr:MAG: hypothetical protein JSV83_04335 [Desulfobacterales bacterium]